MYILNRNTNALVKMSCKADVAVYSDRATPSRRRRLCPSALCVKKYCAAATAGAAGAARSTRLAQRRRVAIYTLGCVPLLYAAVGGGGGARA